jgi:uncharacterized protein (UPF0305 family)
MGPEDEALTKQFSCLMQIYTTHINKPNHVFRPGDRQVRKEIEQDYCPQ